MSSPLNSKQVAGKKTHQKAPKTLTSFGIGLHQDDMIVEKEDDEEVIMQSMASGNA